MRLLDEDNIRIISALNEHGPRNLQSIARELKIPYPTLYSRVARLEEEGVLHIWCSPNYSRIGLSRGMALVDPLPGKELLVREALRIPNWWVRLMRCMGQCNGYYSLHAVPTLHATEFEEYIEQFVPLGLASNAKVYWLEDQHTFIPNFEYYDLASRKWKFPWLVWANLLAKMSDDSTMHDRNHSSFRNVSFDTRDLYVVKELYKDATVKLADIARMFGITLPAAKYRFDSVMKKGLVQEYVFDILPYAPEMSELYEVRLDFRNDNALRSSSQKLSRLPFVLSYSKFKGLNSLAVRIYLPRGEMNNLIAMLSLLVREGILTNFTYIWLESLTLKAQTFSFEKYREGIGWNYDNNEYNNSLQNLLSSVSRRTPSETLFEPMSMTTLQ
jgi:DNA-binding Lrp family transcriptional regulator